MPPVFRRTVPIQIRFNDVDSYGHVNNNAYFAYYDLGKEDYLSHVLHPDFRAQPVVPVIANISADFLQPVLYGDKVLVETRCAHVGNKSFTLEQRAVRAKDGVEVCRCTTVMVCFDPATQSSAAMPEAYRRAFLAFEGGEPTI